jgi:hypothetical protein
MANWRFQISIRTILEITAAVAVIHAFVLSRGSTTAPKPARYHYISSERHGLILYDSITGRYWQRSRNEWVPYNPPSGIGP